eukprot:INCI9549.1.p1 GENE.INCI9549.1~~INCI9549.1.p1  ORF type:complete len:3338 (-),score=497.03 INCI9549.1:375-10388(-)
MSSTGGDRRPSFSAAALYAANHSMVLQELDDAQDSEAPDEVVEVRTLLADTILFEDAVHRLRQRIRAKYRTCQKLMMGCWKLEEKIASTSTESSMTGQTVTGNKTYRKAVLDEAKVASLRREFDQLQDFVTSDLAFVCYNVKLQILKLEKVLRKIMDAIQATSSISTRPSIMNESQSCSQAAPRSRDDVLSHTSENHDAEVRRLLPLTSQAHDTVKAPSLAPINIETERPKTRGSVRASTDRPRKGCFLLKAVAAVLFEFLQHNASDELKFFLSHWINKLFRAALAPIVGLDMESHVHDNIGKKGDNKHINNSSVLRYFFFKICKHRLGSARNERGVKTPAFPLFVPLSAETNVFDGYISLLHAATIFAEYLKVQDDEFVIVSPTDAEQQAVPRAVVQVSPDLLLESIIHVLPNATWLGARPPNLRISVSEPGSGNSARDEFASVDYILHSLNELQITCYLKFPRSVVAVRRILAQWVKKLHSMLHGKAIRRAWSSERTRAPEAATQTSPDALAVILRKGLHYCMVYTGAPAKDRELGYTLYQIARSLPIDNCAFPLARTQPQSGQPPLQSQSCHAPSNHAFDVAMVNFWIHVFGPEFFTTSYIFGNESSTSFGLHSRAGSNNQSIGKGRADAINAHNRAVSFAASRHMVLKQLKLQIDRAGLSLFQGPNFSSTVGERAGGTNRFSDRGVSDKIDFAAQNCIRDLASMILELWSEQLASYEIGIISRCECLLRLGISCSANAQLCSSIMNLSVCIGILSFKEIASDREAHSDNSAFVGTTVFHSKVFEQFVNSSRSNGSADPMETLLQILGQRAVSITNSNACIVNALVGLAVADWIPSHQAVDLLCQWVQLPHAAPNARLARRILLTLNFEQLYKTARAEAESLPVSASNIVQHLVQSQVDGVMQCLNTFYTGIVAVDRQIVGDSRVAGGSATQDHTHLNSGTGTSATGLLDAVVSRLSLQHKQLSASSQTPNEAKSMPILTALHARVHFLWRFLLLATKQSSNFVSCLERLFQSASQQGMRDEPNFATESYFDLLSHALSDLLLLVRSQQQQQSSQSRRCAHHEPTDIFHPLEKMTALLHFIKSLHLCQCTGLQRVSQVFKSSVLPSIEKLVDIVEAQAVQCTETSSAQDVEAFALLLVAFFRLVAKCTSLPRQNSAHDLRDLEQQITVFHRNQFTRVLHTLLYTAPVLQRNDEASSAARRVFQQKDSSLPSASIEYFFVASFFEELKQAAQSKDDNIDPLIGDTLWDIAGVAMATTGAQLWCRANASGKSENVAATDCSFNEETNQSIVLNWFHTSAETAEQSLMSLLLEALRHPCIRSDDGPTFPYFLSHSRFLIVCKAMTHVTTALESGFQSVPSEAACASYSRGIAKFQKEFEALLQLDLSHPSSTDVELLHWFVLLFASTATIMSYVGASESLANKTMAVVELRQVWALEFVRSAVDDALQLVRLQLVVVLDMFLGHLLPLASSDKAGEYTTLHESLLSKVLSKVSATEVAIVQYMQPSVLRNDSSLQQQFKTLRSRLVIAREALRHDTAANAKISGRTPGDSNRSNDSQSIESDDIRQTLWSMSEPASLCMKTTWNWLAGSSAWWLTMTTFAEKRETRGGGAPVVRNLDSVKNSNQINVSAGASCNDSVTHNAIEHGMGHTQPSARDSVHHEHDVCVVHDFATMRGVGHFVDCCEDVRTYNDRFRQIDQQHQNVAGKFLQSFQPETVSHVPPPANSRRSESNLTAGIDGDGLIRSGSGTRQPDGPDGSVTHSLETSSRTTRVDTILSLLKRMILAFRRAAGSFAATRHQLGDTMAELLEVLPTLYQNLPKQAVEVKHSRMQRRHFSALWALVRLRVFSFLEHEVFLKSFPVELHYTWDEATPNDETALVMVKAATALNALIEEVFPPNVGNTGKKIYEGNGWVTSLQLLAQDESFEWELVNSPDSSVGGGRFFDGSARSRQRHVVLFPPRLEWANTVCLGPLCAAVVTLSGIVDDFVAEYRHSALRHGPTHPTTTRLTLEGIECFFAVLDIDSAHTRAYPPTQLIIDSLLQQLGPVLRAEESGKHMARLLAALLGEPDRIHSLATVFQPRPAHALELLNTVYEASGRLRCEDLNALLQQFAECFSLATLQARASTLDGLLDVTADFLHELDFSRALEPGSGSSTKEKSPELLCVRCQQNQTLPYHSRQGPERIQKQGTVLGANCSNWRTLMVRYHCRTLLNICCFDINKYFVHILRVLFGRTGLRVLSKAAWQTVFNIPQSVWKHATLRTVREGLELFQSRSWLKREEGPIGSFRPRLQVSTAPESDQNDDVRDHDLPTTNVPVSPQSLPFLADSLRKQEKGLLDHVLGVPLLLIKVVALLAGNARAADSSTPFSELADVTRWFLDAFNPWLVYRITAAWQRMPEETTLDKMRDNTTGKAVSSALASTLANIVQLAGLFETTTSNSAMSSSHTPVETVLDEVLAWFASHVTEKAFSTNVLVVLEDRLSQLPWSRYRLNIARHVKSLTTVAELDLPFATAVVNIEPIWSRGSNANEPPGLTNQHFSKYICLRLLSKFWGNDVLLGEIAPALDLSPLVRLAQTTLDIAFIRSSSELTSGEQQAKLSIVSFVQDQLLRLQLVKRHGTPREHVGITDGFQSDMARYFLRHVLPYLTHATAFTCKIEGFEAVSKNPILDDLLRAKSLTPTGPNDDHNTPPIPIDSSAALQQRATKYRLATSFELLQVFMPLYLHVNWTAGRSETAARRADSACHAVLAPFFGALRLAAAGGTFSLPCSSTVHKATSSHCWSQSLEVLNLLRISNEVMIERLMELPKPSLPYATASHLINDLVNAVFPNDRPSNLGHTDLCRDSSQWNLALQTHRRCFPVAASQPGGQLSLLPAQQCIAEIAGKSIEALLCLFPQMAAVRNLVANRSARDVALITEHVLEQLSASQWNRWSHSDSAPPSIRAEQPRLAQLQGNAEKIELGFVFEMRFNEEFWRECRANVLPLVAMKFSLDILLQASEDQCLYLTLMLLSFAAEDNNPPVQRQILPEPLLEAVVVGSAIRREDPPAVGVSLFLNQQEHATSDYDARCTMVLDAESQVHAVQMICASLPRLPLCGERSAHFLALLVHLLIRLAAMRALESRQIKEAKHQRDLARSKDFKDTVPLRESNGEVDDFEQVLPVDLLPNASAYDLTCDVMQVVDVLRRHSAADPKDEASGPGFFATSLQKLYSWASSGSKPSTTAQSSALLSEGDKAVAERAQRARSWSNSALRRVLGWIADVLELVANPVPRAKSHESAATPSNARVAAEKHGEQPSQNVGDAPENPPLAKLAREFSELLHEGQLDSATKVQAKVREGLRLCAAMHYSSV